MFDKIGKVILMPTPDYELPVCEFNAVNGQYGECGELTLQGKGRGITMQRNKEIDLMRIKPNDLPIVIAKLDISTLGRIMALWGCYQHSRLWELADFVDCHGMYRIHEMKMSEATFAQLYAYHMYVESYSERPYTQPTDVTPTVKELIVFLIDIIKGTDRGLRMMEMGAQWYASRIATVENALIDEERYCRCFKVAENSGTEMICAAAFYSPKMKSVAMATLTLSEDERILLAFEDGGVKLDAADVAKMLWGCQSDGPSEFATSPIEVKMSVEDLKHASAAVQWLIKKELRKNKSRWRGVRYD